MLVRPQPEQLMIEAKGKLWEYPASWRCITTNATINSSGYLVMGKSCALEAKQRFPLLPKKLGEWVLAYGNRPFLCRGEGLITFPTKTSWRDLSNALLIRESANKIRDLADKFSLRDIVMPRPGCGCGGLTWDFVKPYIEDVLDNRFTVLENK